MANAPFSKGSGRTALGGVLAAGSLAILWLACLAPSGRMGLTAVAGLFPMAGVLAAGRGMGYLCWAAAGLLGLVLLPDKGVPVLYLIFLGIYPVIKSRIEAIRRRPVEWVLKLAFFNAALTIAWFVLRGLLLPHLPPWLGGRGVLLCVLGNLVFLAYDFGLSKLIALLLTRLGPGRRAGPY